MAVNLSPVGGVAAQFFNNNGVILSGGKIFTYSAGTTTNQPTYTSASGGIAHTNPIILDSAGRVPSGEIWLTDGLAYKFVITDSNDVLIGTYDNIIGINSNFVNFTNEQEIQTATAGQTVFNLTTMQYQPGTNSLSVFVDGVNQYGPGALYAYVETDSDTVTFVSGLHVGASVKFTTSQLNSSGAVDAAQVSYDPPFVGSVPTNVEDKLAQTVSVKDFGAVGDGIVNDRAAIQAAFDSGAKQVYFPEGTYWLGSTSTAINFIDLSALGENLAIVTNGFVEFVVETTASVIPNIFYLKDNSHFKSGAVRFKDLGYDPLVTFRGARGFCLDNNAGNWGDVVIDAVYAQNLVTPVGVVSQVIDAANRIRGIKIGQLFADDCYQGFNAQNSGDGVVIDNLIAFKTYRAYLVYGVSDHSVNVYARDTRLTSGNVNISRSVGGLNTSGITVKYVNRDTTTPNVAHVNVNHIDLLGGTISKIDLNIDIQSSVAYVPCKFVNYTGLGGSETAAASLNLVQDVTLSGSCDANATVVDVVASYAATRRMIFNQGYFFRPNTLLYTKFQFNQQITTGTPQWITPGPDPVLGNGSLSYTLRIVEGMSFVTMKLVLGSTTTFGTGNWTFLGFGPNATETVLGTWLAKVGSNFYSGAVRILTGTTEIKGYGYNDPNEFFSGFPAAWGAGDELTITIAYPIS